MGWARQVEEVMQSSRTECEEEPATGQDQRLGEDAQRKSGRKAVAKVGDARVKGAGLGEAGNEVLRQGRACEEKVSQQGNHGQREDRGEE